MTLRDRPGTPAVLLLLLLLASAPAGAQGYRTLTVEGGPSASDPASRRVALVIGNAAYAHAPALRNSTNDATDISAALTQYGFNVISGTDLSQEQMDDALMEFRALAQDADAAMVYYAGHGVQVGGENYLLPVDANVEHQSQVRFRSMPLEQVMNVLADTRSRLKLVVLDACRDNPFASMRSMGSGLANVSSAPSGTYIAYATAPGRRASDNPAGRNGLFTAALLEEMRAPGVELSQMMRRVYERVSRESDSAQEPWTAGAYRGEFFFVPPGGAAGPALASAPSAGAASAGSGVSAAQTAAWSAEAAASFHARSYAAALPPLQRAAAAGDAPSQTRLAVMYQHGWGVLEDPREAVRLYQLAAASGDAVAQGNLGYMYHHGRGVPVNAGEAARLYRLAADQGRASARNNLGTLFQTGSGVARDDAEAVRLYRLASDGALAEGTANLAFMVEHGRGVAADCAQARTLYTTAGAAGHAVAAARAQSLTCRAAGR